MSPECKYCREGIKDSERLSDQSGVPLEWHRQCVEDMHVEIEELQKLAAIISEDTSKITVIMSDGTSKIKDAFSKWKSLYDLIYDPTRSE